MTANRGLSQPCYALHRPLTPRHPPWALNNLTHILSVRNTKRRCILSSFCYSLDIPLLTCKGGGRDITSPPSMSMRTSPSRTQFRRTFVIYPRGFNPRLGRVASQPTQYMGARTGVSTAFRGRFPPALRLLHQVTACGTYLPPLPGHSVNFRPLRRNKRRFRRPQADYASCPAPAGCHRPAGIVCPVRRPPLLWCHCLRRNRAPDPQDSKRR